MLHLIPQMGKHWNTTSEPSFPQTESQELSLCSFLLFRLQQQILSHNSPPFFRDDNKCMWFIGAGNNSLLFEQCVQLVLHQSVNWADKAAATFHSSALMSNCEQFDVEESYMQKDNVTMQYAQRKAGFICQELWMHSHKIIQLIPLCHGPPLLSKTHQLATLYGWDVSS